MKQRYLIFMAFSLVALLHLSSANAAPGDAAHEALSPNFAELQVSYRVSDIETVIGIVRKSGPDAEQAMQTLSTMILNFYKRAPVDRGSGSDGPYSHQQSVPLKVYYAIGEFLSDSNPHIASIAKNLVAESDFILGLARASENWEMATPEYQRMTKAISTYQGETRIKLLQLLSPNEGTRTRWIGQGDWLVSDGIVFLLGETSFGDHVAENISRFARSEGYVEILEQHHFVSETYIAKLLENSHDIAEYPSTPGTLKALERIENEIGTERIDGILTRFAERASEGKTFSLTRAFGVFNYWNKKGRLGPNKLKYLLLVKRHVVQEQFRGDNPSGQRSRTKQLMYKFLPLIKDATQSLDHPALKYAISAAAKSEDDAYSAGELLGLDPQEMTKVWRATHGPRGDVVEGGRSLRSSIVRTCEGLWVH